MEIKYIKSAPTLYSNFAPSAPKHHTIKLNRDHTICLKYINSSQHHQNEVLPISPHPSILRCCTSSSCPDCESTHTRWLQTIISSTRILELQVKNTNLIIDELFKPTTIVLRFLTWVHRTTIHPAFLWPSEILSRQLKIMSAVLT